MGAWGYGNLENDTAADFLGAFRDEPTAEKLFQPIATINYLADHDQELESHDCCEALAAAEIVAASRNQALAALPADVRSLAESLDLTDYNYLDYQQLMLLTRRAVGVIAEESDLRELWAEEVADLAAWELVLSELQQRLRWQAAYDTDAT